MKRLLRLTLLLLPVIIGAAGTFYVYRELQTPHPEPGSQFLTLIEIPKGLRARDVVGLLQDRNVIRSRYVALGYILYTGNRNRLQAGEYLFNRPLTIPEVVHKIVSGQVYLHKFTVPEGLTVRETAQKWEEQGFGSAVDFLKAAETAVEQVRRFDTKAASVEGYLFPETYSFPARTTAAQAVQAMITGFERAMEQLNASVSATRWPFNIRETVVLASLVETEVAHDEERGLVASVFLNRLKRGLLLQCDPTVIYALEQVNRYRGFLTRADLQFKSPYNTYLNPGLPPGPIANPGYKSLLAAVLPSTTKYLYFVRTAGGRHTFSETLAAHNRAVNAYRRNNRRQGS
jgi:UPF0755 protein